MLQAGLSGARQPGGERVRGRSSLLDDDGEVAGRQRGGLRGDGAVDAQVHERAFEQKYYLKEHCIVGFILLDFFR